MTSVPSDIDKKQTNSVLCYQNSIHNGLSITNNDNLQSCGTQKKQNHSIQTTSNHKYHAQHISTKSVKLVNLHTNTKLSPVGK